ncbi:MAG: cysteine desulfurase, partial [Clostridiales bacterium]|nr:cysteine desulfurase [Clostridiales bacterium]
IDRLQYYYAHENSNVHRAAHMLARRTTEAYEGARRKIAAFINAPEPDNIVFVRGATEAINLAASSYGLMHVGEGDEILLTELEHHANIVPWQLLCKKTGARLKFAPIDDSGRVILSEFRRLLSPRTKIAAFSHVSNVLGTVLPAEELIRLAHSAGATVLVDGAQAVSHLPVDVTALDADFYVFSGHKLFGPTGIGVLYGKTELLREMPPYQGGGSMITDVTIEESRFKEPPHRFEAGTGNIAGAVGLGCAVDYVSKIGLEAVRQYERNLTEYATQSFSQIPGIAVIGSSSEKSGIISFVVNGIGSDTLAALLDREGIAVRAGHHCAQPVLRRFGCETAVRASFALYNTFEEIDALISVLCRVKNQY